MTENTTKFFFNILFFAVFIAFVVFKPEEQYDAVIHIFSGLNGLLALLSAGIMYHVIKTSNTTYYKNISNQIKQAMSNKLFYFVTNAIQIMLIPAVLWINNYKIDAVIIFASMTYTVFFYEWFARKLKIIT